MRAKASSCHPSPPGGSQQEVWGVGNPQGVGFGWGRFVCPRRVSEIKADNFVFDVSTHFYFFCRILADPGIVRDGSGTSFLGPRGRFRAPGGF